MRTTPPDMDAERLAATIVTLWRAEKGDDRTLVKYIKQTLSGVRSATPPPDVTERARRAVERFSLVLTCYLSEDERKRLADIIAAEFERGE